MYPQTKSFGILLTNRLNEYVFVNCYFIGSVYLIVIGIFSRYIKKCNRYTVYSTEFVRIIKRILQV